MTPRPIRLLFFTREEFPTYRVDVEVLFGRELIGRGHAIDLVMQAQSEDVAVGSRRWHGRTAFVGPTADSRGFIGRALKQLRSLWHDVRSLRHARSENYDAIQVRDKFLVAAIGVVIARRRRLKFFFWLSFPMPEHDLLHARSENARYPMITYIRGVLTGWLLYRWIIPRSDHVFVQSDRMKIAVCARGANPERVTAVPMAVDLAEVPTVVREQAAVELVETRLGYLGTLDANRHLEVLVDMLAILRGSGMAATLVLIGDAAERRDRELLERRATALGVSQYVQFTGFLPRLKALERMSSVDIGLSAIYPSPIFNVGSPTKLIEYLALGIPVVANAHPEQRAILRMARAGICVPWGARYFAKGVRYLTRCSREQRNVMGELGRTWVRENRSYTLIADDVERTYRAVLAGAAR